MHLFLESDIEQQIIEEDIFYIRAPAYTNFIYNDGGRVECGGCGLQLGCIARESQQDGYLKLWMVEELPLQSPEISSSTDDNESDVSSRVLISVST